jgi:hypothetical protein
MKQNKQIKRFQFVCLVACVMMSFMGCVSNPPPKPSKDAHVQKNQPRVRINQFRDDFRLMLIDETELKTLKNQKKCLLIRNYTRNYTETIAVGDGKSLGDILAPWSKSDFSQDSPIVIFKSHLITRRLLWTEDDTTRSSAAEFSKIIILPGDIIWLLPVVM